MPLIASGLTFAYPRGPHLLDGLDLSVPGGSSAAVMAPSGVGKTTLLAVLGGLRRPTSGSVSLSADGGGTVAWVFQEMHLLPRRTVLDNVTIGAMPRGIRRAGAEPRALAALARFDVEELAGRSVRTLSGGQRQRVALARAAIGEPALVLADEPTANLDRANAAAVAQVLATGFPGAVVIIATHDPVVAACTDVTYLLVDGRLERAS